MKSCDTVQETSKSIASLKIEFIPSYKLAESATWSSGRSSVDAMTILLIAFDSTPIHDTTFVQQHVFNAGLYFWGEKNCVTNVDTGQECAKNRTPSRSATIGVYLVEAGAVLPRV